VDSGASLELQALTQTLSLSGAIPGTTVVSLSFNGASSSFTYSGTAATDITRLTNALNAMLTASGIAGATVNVSANATDTPVSISFGGTLTSQSVPTLGAAIAPQSNGIATVTGLTITNEALYLNGIGTGLGLETGTGKGNAGALENLAGNNVWSGN